jgi:DNA-binding transcriptional LysR family regulator
MLDALSLDQLRVFVAIADQGSFSAAARHLRRAQSAVSNAIANLESVLGVSLFDRRDWKPQLTIQGRALLIDARAVLARADQLKNRAKGLADGLEPELFVVVDVFFPVSWLVNLVTCFQKAFPDVSLRLRTEVLGGVPEMVLTNGYCLGIQGSFPDIAPNLVSYVLPEIRLEPVAAPFHRLADSLKVSRELLREHTQIILTDHSRRTEGRLFSVYADQRILTSDLGSKQAMLRAGLGWGFMPLTVVEEDLQAERLVTLDLADRPPRSRKMPLYLIHRYDDPPGLAGQWVMKQLIQGDLMGETAAAV